ncbi:MAG: SAF domain-containing protein [bacterium]
MNDSEIDLVRSVRRALWTLVIFMSLLAAGAGAQLTTNMYWWWIKGRSSPDQSIRVVVAARDLKAGTVLRPEDIGEKIFKVAELPVYFI